MVGIRPRVEDTHPPYSPPPPCRKIDGLPRKPTGFSDETYVNEEKSPEKTHFIKSLVRANTEKHNRRLNSTAMCADMIGLRNNYTLIVIKKKTNTYWPIQMRFIFTLTLLS